MRWPGHGWRCKGEVITKKARRRRHLAGNSRSEFSDQRRLLNAPGWRFGLLKLRPPPPISSFGLASFTVS